MLGMSGSKRNDRRYPGESGRCRPDQANGRREAAMERQASYDRLTVEEKIARLDARFGEGVGAKRERARLVQKLTGATKADKSDNSKSSELGADAIAEIESMNSATGKKKLKAKERRSQEK